MIYLYLFGTCFHFIYVFMIIGNEYFERVKTYINTYSNDASTHSALLRILLGQLPFKGKSPVNLEHKLFTF